MTCVWGLAQPCGMVRTDPSSKTSKAAKKTRNKGAKKTPKSEALRRVPEALRETAQKLVERAKSELAAEANDLLARAKGALAQSNRNLYEVARALFELSKPNVAQALGRGDVFALAQAELDMPRTTVDRLITAAEHVTQERFAELKPSRVNACLELATATVADDTEAILAGKRIRLWPKGPWLDVGKATTAEILAAAKEVRQHHAKDERPKRGRTTTPEERAFVERASKQLAKSGSGARMKARATRAGQPSVFDLVGMTQEEAERALKALR